MTQLTKIVDQIKQATDYQANKKILREKICTDLHLVHNGGLFFITPELLAFLQTWPGDEVFLEDTHQNPIKINKNSFLVQAQEHYQQVMNEWHIQYEELRKIRKV